MKKSTLKILIPIIIWISILVVIGLSINKRWGDHWGYTIPLAFLLLSFREVLKFGKDIKENSAPRVSDAPHTRDTPPTIHKDIKITKEDIEGDLHEGRD
jgi:hypothetical protein